MSSLQVVFDEINKNESVGMNQLHPLIISNETFEFILDSFDYDPETETYLSQLSEVLQIHRHEQQNVFDLLDGFLFQYMGQIKHEKENPVASAPSSAPSVPSASAPCTYPYPLPPFPQMKTNMMLTVPQKKRQNFSREITNVLSQWLFTHCDHPYPSEHEKSVLCSLTGLSLSQVSGWFINARRRKLKKMNESASIVSTPCEHVVGKNEIALNYLTDNMNVDFSMQ